MADDLDVALHRIAVVTATDPGAIGAGRAWLDLTGTLHVRDPDNAAWIAVSGGGTPPPPNPALPLGLVGSATRADADWTVPSVATDVPGLTVTGSVGAGRALEVTLSVGAFNQTDTTTVVIAFTLYRDSVLVAAAPFGFDANQSSVGNTVGCTLIGLDKPPAGTFTWRANAQMVGGNASLNIGPRAPAFLIVKDIGGA